MQVDRVYDFISSLMNEIQEEKKVKSENVALGHMKSFEDYKHQTGVIQGLDSCLYIIKTLADKMENSDE